MCPADWARPTACFATVEATRLVRLTIDRARARGLGLRLDERRADDLRPVLRFAVPRFTELRFAELRLLELFFLAVLRLAELRLVELRFAELRLAELRFAVRFVLPRAADFLRDDFFAAIDVCSC